MTKAKAFTLVEILVMVVVLGILAAIVIPMAGSGTNTARTSCLAQDLRVMRTHILFYKSQHTDTAPGYPDGDKSQAPTEEMLINQTSLCSTKDGQTASRGTPGFPYGPYLRNIPKNPFNDKKTVQMLGNAEDFPAAADNSHGWVYKTATAEIRADCMGADDNGKRYYDY